ncbi:DUF748 domain-containing protein [uncultured Alistipes sp.]|jgi:hypothetical protein|uniref:DUF748 domain-containing protein n=1 Tax=uncultured Alistipes sp. TaxID=538949 RepID=UPI00260060B3|nr:DUF748 domain-containing protein [uncultured Alistipes sp.]
MKKWVKVTLIVAGAIAGLLIAVAIAIPPVAKSYIEKHDHELIGRSIHMERLRFNIFTGRMRIHDLRVGSANDTTTFFRLDSFDMRIRLWPLLSNRMHIKKISFTGANMKIYQRGEKFSFDDLLERFVYTTTTATQEAAEASKPWEIGIYNISIRRSHIFYKDLLLNATWGLNDVSLHIPGVYFSGAKTDVETVLNFAEGGTLSTDVGYNIETSEFDIGLKLNDFTLAGTLPYFRQMLDVESVGGHLSADIRLKGDLEHLLASRLEGTTTLTNFALVDRHDRPVVGVDTLVMKLKESDLGKQHYDFERIYVSGFSSLLEITPEGNTFTALMKSGSVSNEVPIAIAEAVAQRAGAVGTSTGTEATAKTVVAPATAVPSLYIADLVIKGGRVVVRDLTLHTPFEYTVSDIRMRSRGFDPSKRNNLTVDARMHKTGSAKLRWEGSLDNLDNHNITLLLSNLDLCDFGPYCEYYTAYPITKGNLSFRSQNVIRNRQLDGTNHLDVFEPEVDKKRKDITPEMNVPLKLGLYVLRDKRGHVKMDLPIKGSIDSPEFSYRKIVMKAIGNVLLKVVTAPFSFLSGNKDKLEYINLDPLQREFTSEQYAALDKIAQALKEKPDMHVTLLQRINVQRALPRQAANALRLDYARHLRTADSAEHRQVSMLEYEKIQQMDIRTPALMAFADSLLRAKGIAPQKLSPDTKAMTLYREKAAGQLSRMMASRDRAIAEYMQSTHEATAPVFLVQSMDSATLLSYAGKDRYTIGIEVNGETVEVETEDNNGLPVVQADSTALGVAGAVVEPVSGAAGKKSDGKASKTSKKTANKRTKNKAKG